MLAYRETRRDPNDLRLGGNFAHVDYLWKPYDRRTAEHQENYRRLETDMRNRGMLNPLIVFRDCVLIGQRRCEIARKLGWEVVRCFEITDDISHDTQPDRVIALRDQAYLKVTY